MRGTININHAKPRQCLFHKLKKKGGQIEDLEQKPFSKALTLDEFRVYS
jgi:hypothetical protein